MNHAADAVPVMFDSFAFWTTVFSLVVGISSVIMAGFAIWLSWQFFKASQTQSDRTTDAVSRIENVVNSVNASINQIVERAVSAWVKAPGSSAEESIAAELAESYNELREKLDALEKKGASETLPPDVISLLVEGQARTEALLSSLRESRARSVFSGGSPNVRPPAVTVEKSVSAIGDGREKGEITLEVHRPAIVITGTAALECGPLKEAEATLKMISSDPAGPKMRVAHGFSRGSELNIHLRTEGGALVPVGTYVLEYEVNGKSGSTEASSAQA